MHTEAQIIIFHLNITPTNWIIFCYVDTEHKEILKRGYCALTHFKHEHKVTILDLLIKHGQNFQVLQSRVL